MLLGALILRPASFLGAYPISRCSLISSNSGKRPISFLLKMRLPFRSTANTPPVDGTISSEVTFVLYAPRTSSARPTALGR
jgi:hypothetical protein